MKKGFTLIERMIVIAIIGIFASVVLVSYNSSLEKSRDATRLGDLKSISLAIQNYWQDSGYKTWPTNLSDVSVYFSGGVPNDPSSHQPYLYTPFSLDTGTGKNDFCLGAKMEVISATTTCNMQTYYAQGKSYPKDYNYTYVGP